MTAVTPPAKQVVEAEFADRLPDRLPGWWCWRCGWWQTETPGVHRPAACPDCAAWSKERRLPLDTIRPVLATLETR